MELLLIRHALPVRVESESGRADPALAELGQQQAEALAGILGDEGITSLFVSPMRRARQTAAPVERELGLTAEVIDGLVEFDHASSSYVPVEELRAAKDQRWVDVIEGRWGGEDGLDPMAFRDGVVEAIEEIITAHAGEKIAAVSHGGVINAYVSHVLGAAHPVIFEPIYASITRVLAASSGPRTMKSMNEAAHVKGLLPPGVR